MSGKLYGIGLGPGDPELMTLKAARLINAADVVAYPALPGVDSFARKIAETQLKDGVEELRIDVPMTPDRAPAQAAYDQGAAEISAVLASGRDVVFLCEGDPLFYGSFMYLLARLAEGFQVEVVPGVTAITACAASLSQPLAARNEVLTIIPGPLAPADMTRRIKAADAVAIMKVGRHLGKIRDVLRDLDLLDKAAYVERASLPQERRLPLADAPDPAPYFSMILLTKGSDPWL